MNCRSAMKTPFLRNTTALLMLILAVAGCATHRDVWVPPSTPEGTMCVANCNAALQACQFSQQSAYQQCQSNYALQMNTYALCKAQQSCITQRESIELQARGNRTTKPVCEGSASFNSPCIEPKRCDTQFSASRCEQNQRTCFMACGGRIDRVKLD